MSIKCREYGHIHTNKFAVIVLVLLGYLLGGSSCGPLCYSCTSIPHPRDCGRIIQCGDNQDCYVEKYVTASGNLFFNSGCSDKARCLPSGRRSIANVTNPKSIGHVGVRQSTDIPVCYQCCSQPNYCNRNLCESSDDRTGGMMCLHCPDVVSPEDCEFVIQCVPGEMCYTENIFINGENRYRLGCIEDRACVDRSSVEQTTVGSQLVGKRFLADDYCAKCCSDPTGNCNRQLCDPSGKAPPPTTKELTLVIPPARTDYCEDLTPLSCQLLGLQNNRFCHNITVKNYACRQFCGTCVNTGDLTPAPSGPAVTVSPVQQNPRDCFFDSGLYQGNINESVSSSPCLPWSQFLKVIPKLQDALPDQTPELAANNCRDPTGKGHPWCFVSNTNTSSDGWEYCNVPYCPECYYGDGTTFNGHVSVASDNKSCENWLDVPLTLPDELFIDGSKVAAKNYCRSLPVVNFGGIKCYSDGKFMACNLSRCEGKCEDDVNTACEALEGIVCKNEYYSVTLCPKTCRQCGVGLSRPRIVPPPTDSCTDTPEGNCEILKGLICAEPLTAQRFCPKTCGVCNAGIKSTYSPMTSTTTIMTSATTTAATTTPTAMTSPGPVTPPPVWGPWGPHSCNLLQGNCVTVRYRNCSTGDKADCPGTFYNFGTCNSTLCPDMTTMATTTQAPFVCQDKPGFCIAESLSDVCKEPGAARALCPVSCNVCTITTKPPTVTAATGSVCKDAVPCEHVLEAVCKDPDMSRNVCPKSCGKCDEVCKDSPALNCSNPKIQHFFCSDPALSVTFCPKTCNKCYAPLVNVTLNSCGDPVASDVTCKFLHHEICLCFDPGLNSILCPNFCNHKCGDVEQCSVPTQGRRDTDLIEAAYVAANFHHKRKWFVHSEQRNV